MFCGRRGIWNVAWTTARCPKAKKVEEYKHLHQRQVLLSTWAQPCTASCYFLFQWLQTFLCELNSWKEKQTGTRESLHSTTLPGERSHGSTACMEDSTCRKVWHKHQWVTFNTPRCTTYPAVHRRQCSHSKVDWIAGISNLMVSTVYKNVVPKHKPFGK